MWKGSMTLPTFSASLMPSSEQGQLCPPCPGTVQGYVRWNIAGDGQRRVLRITLLSDSGRLFTKFKFAAASFALHYVSRVELAPWFIHWLGNHEDSRCNSDRRRWVTLNTAFLPSRICMNKSQNSFLAANKVHSIRYIPNNKG